MKAINVLLINYNSDAMDTYAPLLYENGVVPQAAATMLSALQLLLSGEYSGVVINADGFDYLPYLKIMRELTPIPIGVSVSQYNKEEHDAAIENGADLYRVRYDDAKHRVRGFSNIIKIYLEFSKGQNGAPTAISYNDIQIFPDIYKVFIKGQEIELQRLEVGILSYLIINKGRILSHEQIYSNVWGKEYAGDSRGTLWSQISKMRKKLREEAALPDFIKTERGIGYSIDK